MTQSLAVFSIADCNGALASNLRGIYVSIFEKTGSATSAPGRALLAAGLAAILVMGEIVETRSLEDQPLVSDSNQRVVAFAQLAVDHSSASEATDWSRVSVASEAQGASVAAYGN